MICQMKKTILTRKDLFDLIWSKSSHFITDQLNISTYRLLKICNENQVPTPSTDWWTETTINEISYKPDLYVDGSCKDDEVIEIISDREIRKKRINEIRVDIEESCGDYITVPNRLFSPDQLVQNTKYALEIKTSSSSGREHDFVDSNRKQLSIFVTKENVSRSLRILDTFIKLIRERGHSIEMNYNEYKIHIGDEYYEFSIREKYKKIEIKEKWHDHDYVPTGLLVLSVGRWSDKKEFIDSGILVEKKLSYALAYLEYTAEEWKRSREINELHRLKREEEEQLAQEIIIREKQERERFNNLIERSNRWKQAQIIREFIYEVEQRSNDTIISSENLREWIDWAKVKVDDYDPLGGNFNPL
jgi:hypothetical protein